MIFSNSIQILFLYVFQILRQLECEQQKHAIDTAQGDEVTYMLEKERERLTNEVLSSAFFPLKSVESL